MLQYATLRFASGLAVITAHTFEGLSDSSLAWMLAATKKPNSSTTVRNQPNLNPGTRNILSCGRKIGYFACSSMNAR